MIDHERGQERFCLGSPIHESTYDSHDIYRRNCLGRSKYRGVDEGQGPNPHEPAHGIWLDTEQENCLGKSRHDSVNPYATSYRHYPGRPVLEQSGCKSTNVSLHHDIQSHQRNLGHHNVLGQSKHDPANLWGISYQSHTGCSVLGQSKSREHTENRETGNFWETLLCEAMWSRGWSPIPQYQVMNRRLDFALLDEHMKLDIEVDGRYWHQDANGNRKPDDYIRDAELEGNGWKVIRFWVDELERDLDACLDRIERELYRVKT